jgi:hypothetical protein
MFDIPVLLIVFNRPDFAAQVAKSLKEIRPTKLYIAADGPRSGKEGEAKICQETRDAVLKEVDWDCQVFTRFQDNNLGCALGVSGAINWFFQNEEAGIILEDDCIPDKSFFSFCRDLLIRYKDDEHVMQISGYNDQNGNARGDASYFFSNFPTGWGWASWRRAWQHYDFNVKELDKEFNKNLVRKTFYGNHKAALNWLRLLLYNLDSTWDYQWAYAIFLKNGLCISPNVSLVKNVGFDERSTHTHKPLSNQIIDAGTIDKIVHPDCIAPHKKADELTMAKRYYSPFLKRIYYKTYTYFK